MSKTFLKDVVLEASGALESSGGEIETTGTWGETSAGAETITPPLMQVRDHNGLCRLSAR
jgi:hypothetical protein